MVTDVSTKQFDLVTHIFLDFCRSHGVKPLELAVQNHGSWQWTAGLFDGLNRYLSLGLTSMPSTMHFTVTIDVPSETVEFDLTAYAAEIWFVVDDDLHYRKAMVWTDTLMIPPLMGESGRIPEVKEFTPAMPQTEDDLRDLLWRKFEQGLSESHKIKHEDLLEEYLPSRRRA